MAAPPDPAVRLHEIEKAFGRGATLTRVLDRCSLVAHRGELLTLAGPSGCGKTTLLSVLAGTLRPDRGEVQVLGHRLDQLDAAALSAFRAREVGFIFQQFHLIAALSVVENVAVPLVIQRRPRAEALARARAVLDAVDLGGQWNARPAQLSGGQQQRVAIARALVHEPTLIVCDEPTSALDRRNGHRVMELLRGIADHPQRCVIVVSHDSRVYEFADRIAEMEDGRILHVHSTREEIRRLTHTQGNS